MVVNTSSKEKPVEISLKESFITLFKVDPDYLTSVGSYIHIGKALINGAVDLTQVITDSKELTPLPEDDGLQIIDYVKGDCEWWYFDINDYKSGCFLKIVLHVGTDPLRTRVFPQLAISVNTPEKSESFIHPFVNEELIADTQQCNLSIRDAVIIWVEYTDHPVYFIKIDIPGYKCNFKFTGEGEGWKPFGKKIPYQSGIKKVDFSWLVPIPKARVEGDFYYKDKQYNLFGATGYHDHNYVRPDRKNPLHLDDLAIKWHWGKSYAGSYTVIFADIYCRTNSTLALMVSEQNKIIYSSNNLIECSVLSYGFDEYVKVSYPAALHIKSLDVQFPFQAEFVFDKILDRKDLLEGINPVLKFFIKKLIAKPVYHGILSKVRLNIKNNNLEGSGNFETMVFREK